MNWTTVTHSTNTLLRRAPPKPTPILFRLVLLVTFCLLQTSGFVLRPHHHRTSPAEGLGYTLPHRRQFITNSALSMMKGSVFCAVTLDGFIATTDGDVSFLNEFGDTSDDPPLNPADDPYSFESFLAQVDVLIMGRKTFEKVLSFGRHMWAYGNKRIVVWTTQKDYPIPDYLQESVSCSNLSPMALWDNLQNQGYEHAYIDGGATVSAFAADDLIEDWIITRVPLLLGEGIPLFTPQSSRRLRLVHVHTQASPAGLVTSHYRSRREEPAKKENEKEET